MINITSAVEVTQADKGSDEQDSGVGAIYDKTGREIMVGDVLKVYSFTGARWRKRYYMHKQVMGRRKLGKGESEFFFVSHLNLVPEGERDDGYHLLLDGRILYDYEIVQGCGDGHWFHDRPRIFVPNPPANIEQAG